MKIIKCYRQYTYNNWFPGVRLLFLWNNSYWGVHLKLSKQILRNSANHMYEEKKCKIYENLILNKHMPYLWYFFCYLYCHHFHFAKN